MSAPLPTPPVVRPARSARLWWLGAIVVALAVVAVLSRFDPARHPFYPRCYFKALTGWNCPGCGGLRATHQLLHGHVRAALALNPLLFVILPLAGWYGLAELTRRTSGRTLPVPFRRPVWLWGLLTLVAAFAILRNLPVGPFAAAGP
jgi:hypothetical protein